MRLNIDEDAHVLWLDLDSGVTAANALEQALALLHRMPALWTWDWIVKATVLPTDVTIDHLAAPRRTLCSPGLAGAHPPRLRGPLPAPVGEGDGFPVRAATTHRGPADGGRHSARRRDPRSQLVHNWPAWRPILHQNAGATTIPAPSVRSASPDEQRAGLRHGRK